MEAPPSRAVSPVIANVLLVAVVVVLAATVSVFALGFLEDTNDPGPVVGQSSGTLESNGVGSDNGFVQITHVAGDTIRTANIEIAVDATAACGKRGRLVNLPVQNRIRNSNSEGDDVFDNSFQGLPDGSALENQRYASSDTIDFRIPNTDCPVRNGDRVTVRVVHLPTNSIVIEETLTAS